MRDSPDTTPGKGALTGHLAVLARKRAATTDDTSLSHTENPPGPTLRGKLAPKPTATTTDTAALADARAALAAATVTTATDAVAATAPARIDPEPVTPEERARKLIVDATQVEYLPFQMDSEFIMTRDTSRAVTFEHEPYNRDRSQINPADLVRIEPKAIESRSVKLVREMQRLFGIDLLSGERTMSQGNALVIFGEKNGRYVVQCGSIGLDNSPSTRRDTPNAFLIEFNTRESFTDFFNWIIRNPHEALFYVLQETVSMDLKTESDRFLRQTRYDTMLRSIISPYKTFNFVGIRRYLGEDKSGNNKYGDIHRFERDAEGKMIKQV